MKVLNIRLKNINTLKGEWEIDFDRSPLKEAGLFAITGPNGSGKTTIFDAISLGLYGETARLKNSPEQIMSKQTSDCYATVTFAVGSAVFRSTWSLHLSDGRPLAPEMSLVELNGTEQVLADTIVTARSRVTELIGLDFKRFFRSMVLAQGEFASLLNALDNERIEILEKVVGPDFYTKTLAELNTNAETEDNKLTALKEEIQNMPLMSPPEVKALEDTAEQMEDDLKEAEQRLPGLDAKKQQRRLFDQLNEEHDANQKRLIEVRGRKEKMQPDLLRLEKAIAGEPFVKDLGRLNRSQAKMSEYANTLSALRSEITDLTEQLTTIHAEVNRQALEVHQEQNAWTERRELIEKTIELDREIQTASTLLQKLTEKRSAIETELKIKATDQETTRRQIAENETLLATTERWLKEHVADESLVNDLVELKDALEQLKSCRQDLVAHTAGQKSTQKAEKKSSVLLAKSTRKLEKLRLKAEKLQNRRDKLEKMHTSLLDGESLEQLEKALEDQKKQRMNFKSMLKLCKTYDRQEKGDGHALELVLKSAEQQHGDLLKQLGQEQKNLTKVNNIAKFERCRKQLKDKEPCPLCGSAEHPYAELKPPFDKDPAEIVREQEHLIETLRHQIETLADKIAGLKDRHVRYMETKRQWSQLSHATGTEWTLGDRLSIKVAVRTLKKALRSQKARIRQIRRLTKKMAKLDKALEKQSMKITAKQQGLDQLVDDLNRHNQTLSDIQKETQTVGQRETELVQNLGKRLDVFNQAMPASGTEDEWMRRLEHKRTDYLNHVRKRSELNTRILALKDTALGFPAKIERLQKEVNFADEQVNTEQEALATLKSKRQKLFGTGDALAEKQETEQMLNDRQKELEAVQQQTRQVRRTLSEKENLKHTTEKLWQDTQSECEKIEQKILNAAIAAGFSSLEELQSSLLDSEQRQDLEQQQVAVDNEINQYTKQIEAIRKERDQEDLKALAGQSLEDLNLEVQDLRKQKDHLAQELATASDRLEHQQAAEKEYQQKLQELEQQEKVCDRIHAEKHIFETAPEAEIKMRLRELMLDRLLEHSNKHLEDLSGRYYLRRRVMNGLGLEIEDAHHQKSRRTVNTLSGGESFLVSLSLALGLADMTANGRQIESLFVDEGFGCLDDETLYNVLSTLKNLKKNGKTVGVISHVKKVEDEISTKIKIKKMPGGISRLDVVA